MNCTNDLDQAREHLPGSFYLRSYGSDVMVSERHPQSFKKSFTGQINDISLLDRENGIKLLL